MVRKPQEWGHGVKGWHLEIARIGEMEARGQSVFILYVYCVLGTMLSVGDGKISVKNTDPGPKEFTSFRNRSQSGTELSQSGVTSLRVSNIWLVL